MTQLFALQLLLVAHFIGDFIVQTDRQAQAKSKNNATLFAHVATYSLTMLAVAPFVFGLFGGLRFVLLNAILHFATDWYTSRWASRLYRAEKRHAFFVVIGLDQLIHQATLAFFVWWQL